MLQIVHGQAAGPSTWSAVWLWLGSGLQVCGFLAVCAIASRMRKEDQSHVVPAIFVNLIAACSYFAMATGQLDVRVNHAFVIELPRYFDWQVTTPLLVLSLAMVALPSVQHFRGRANARRSSAVSSAHRRCSSSPGSSPR